MGMKLVSNATRTGKVDAESFIFSWLWRLDRYIARTTDWKITLFFENCSEHRTKESLPDLQNFEVRALPPITTSPIQPSRVGTMVAVKENFRGRLSIRVFDNIDAVILSLYNIQILTAIRSMRGERNSLPDSRIGKYLNNGFRLERENRVDIT